MATDLTNEMSSRLQAIFMPHDTARRKRLFGDNFEHKTAKFAHYTSADAGLKIIKSKRLWMRSTTCMSDYKEVALGYETLRGFFQKPDYKNAFYDAFYSVSAGTSQEILTMFDDYWKDISSTIFITSLTEHHKTEDSHGRLSMWRAFGSGPLVALVFNVPIFSEGSIGLKLGFSPVAYLPEKEAHQSLLDAVASVKANADFLRSISKETVLGFGVSMLLSSAACLKHEGFHEECEWRALYFPLRLGSELMQSEIEVVGGVPQHIFKIPLDEKWNPVLADLEFSRLLERVIIGPTQYAAALYAAFVSALSAAGVPDPSQKVLVSGIPLRS